MGETLHNILACITLNGGMIVNEDIVASIPRKELRTAAKPVQDRDMNTGKQN
jgi:hypothetical protein